MKDLLLAHLPFENWYLWMLMWLMVGVFSATILSSLFAVKKYEILNFFIFNVFLAISLGLVSWIYLR